MAPRVLVVDDHASFRAAATGLLRDAGYDVVGEAADVLAALLRTAALSPDVMLLDIGLPDIDGFEVIARLHALPTPPRVVLVSSRDAADYGERVRTCGAAGFIAKAELSPAALRDVVDGAS
jgi:two-component system nitrate/nitrite response regulator NarL